MFVPVEQYIEIARISQYLASDNIANNNALKGGDLNNNLARLIYLVRKPIQWLFDHDPTNETLNATALYMYALCGRYIAQAEQIIANQSQTAPSLTNPVDDTVADGGTASFSTTVTSSLPFVVQWYKDSVLIPGATSTTYSFTANTVDSGSLYSVTATNAKGSTSSSPATLTVTNVITGYFTYSPTIDFYPILLTNSDPFTYGTSYSITHNANITITLPGAMPANQYMLAKIPVGESIKTVWNNSALNFGSIPDAQFQSIVQFGGFTYYASRGQITMDVSQTLILS